MQDRLLARVTHEAITRAFGLEVPDRRRPPEDDLAGEYAFDPFAGWSGGDERRVS
jgi:hypothetical protein